ncbi:MAG: hypothetical protein LBH98_03755, partial [Chitinispirillales bacterium]|nr:hypothetical protein [Chitinispirillales bacterium]
MDISSLNVKNNGKNLVPRILKILLILGILVLTISCSSDSNDDGGRGDGGEITARTDYELFIAAMSDTKDEGAKLKAQGFEFQAQSFYSFAGAGLAAMRYAVEELLYLKGAGSLAEVSGGSRFAGWDSIAGISYA